MGSKDKDVVKYFSKIIVFTYAKTGFEIYVLTYCSESRFQLWWLSEAAKLGEYH